jgi:hypothetical protein
MNASAASAAPSPATPPDKGAATLDDLMLAMDVVDTLRHREDLVRRELDVAGREAELVDRLREIYRQQGIEVPDHVLRDGVKALAESRFTYTPPPDGWKRRLLTVWVRRRRYGSFAGVGLAAFLGLWSANHFGYVRPAAEQAERARVELTETLPAALRRAHADATAIATDQAVRPRLDALLADGERAVRDRDRAAMQRITAEITALRDELAREYVLRIVSRPGETTGVWRQPPRGSTARNHYLVVEALAPDGSVLELPVRSEETGVTKRVRMHAVRVPAETFERVAADKRDDGIVQQNRLAVKKRGVLALEALMAIENGAITEW